MGDTRIFAFVITFEEAIGIENVPDKRKAATIYGIMNDPDNISIKNRIYSFFDGIFNGQDLNKAQVNIVEMTNESIYDELFSPLNNEEVKCDVEVIN